MSTIDIPSLLANGRFTLADALCQQEIASNGPLVDSCREWRTKIAHSLGLDDRLLDTSNGYHFIRAWGFGFWADVDSLLGQLLIAEITNRTPIVFWGENSRYGGQRDLNAFELYFEPVGRSIDSADWNHGIFPPKWSRNNVCGPDVSKWDGEFSRQSILDFLPQKQAITVADFHTPMAHIRGWIPEWHSLHGQSFDAIYSYLVDRYLHPKKELIDRATAIVDRLFGDTPFIAVHLRGTDKHREEANLEQGISACLDEAAALLGNYPDVQVFVLTDDSRLHARAQSRFGNRMAAMDFTRAVGQTGLHYMLQKSQGHNHGIEVMLDTLVATKAAAFIGIGQSNLPAMVSRLRQWPPGSICLLGGNLQEEFNSYLYRRQSEQGI